MPRRSAAWRSQRDPVVKENEDAGQLNLLGGSSLMVVRNATEAEVDEREVLGPAIRNLAAEARELAKDPGDRGVRQQAADSVLKTIRRLKSDHRVHEAAHDSALAATVVAVRSAAADIMVLAGVDTDEASGRFNATTPISMCRHLRPHLVSPSSARVSCGGEIGHRSGVARSGPGGSESEWHSQEAETEMTKEMPRAQK